MKFHIQVGKGGRLGCTAGSILIFSNPAIETVNVVDSCGCIYSWKKCILFQQISKPFPSLGCWLFFLPFFFLLLFLLLLFLLLPLLEFLVFDASIMAKDYAELETKKPSPKPFVARSICTCIVYVAYCTVSLVFLSLSFTSVTCHRTFVPMLYLFSCFYVPVSTIPTSCCISSVFLLKLKLWWIKVSSCMEITIMQSTDAAYQRFLFFGQS